MKGAPSKEVEIGLVKRALKLEAIGQAGQVERRSISRLQIPMSRRLATGRETARVKSRDGWPTQSGVGLSGAVEGLSRRIYRSTGVPTDRACPERSRRVFVRGVLSPVTAITSFSPP